MIFGKKDEEWHNVFLLIPRRLTDGRWAWLQTVERQKSVSIYGTVRWIYYTKD